MNKCLSIVLTFFIAFSAIAQLNLEYYDSIPVSLDGINQLKNPWAGGLNSPQFSPIDMNGDGEIDAIHFIDLHYWIQDDNYDGVYDRKGIDTDNDMWPDYFEPISMND